MATDTAETLVSRRLRRSTAGNRMEAALAELALQDLNKEAEDDNDFFVENDEEDMFESDFVSTDEEEAQEAPGISAEKAVDDEEKRARKAARSRVERATAAAHTRQKVTFNPHGGYAGLKSPVIEGSGGRAAKKRRVSLGVAVNAETGEIIRGNGPRQSQRKHTVMNTSETVTRLKKSEAKRACITKKTKAVTRELTQDELIARALDTEEGNIVEHRDYLYLEEEKRKRARVVRTAVTGPLLRWVSKVEEVKLPVEPPLPQPATGTLYGYPFGMTPSTYQPYLIPARSYPTGTSYIPSLQVTPAYAPTYASTTPLAVPAQFATAQIPLHSPLTGHWTEKVTKNYVVHELAQFEGIQKPHWKETMEAMFGDHVAWDELRVFVSKGRPLSRPKQLCPITGRIAPYLDPRSGVPFANVAAFQTLSNILRHEYVWSDNLGCYLSTP